ncbi:hypothetical protein C2E25_09910 [Geothermobacter hydrogeniphilus]|uniref:Uncharacterized protein n=1 Tax=Geothermobacter hydrogeniphilus TaxID=1969733 RepID=A0A2K2H9J7_9BACT|nr:glycosyltransferase [Geothermobacter hydrogeniphilus]PNU19976.1 hypothetical protein C2E25_09910 [Geothermobacter hydrogeniphilus]
MILHLIETGGPGGAEQMLLRLAEEYRRRGIEQIVCLRKEGWLAGEVRRRNLPLVISPLGRLPDLAWLRRMRGIALEKGVSGIHAHEFAMNVRGGLLASRLRVPCVATVHGRGYFDEKLSRRLAYRLTSRTTRLVAVSEDILRQLVSAAGVSRKRVRVLANGVDVERFAFDPEKRRRVRAGFGFSDQDVLLGSVGSYYPVKGHRHLVAAMKTLVETFSRVRLVLAGQGPLAEDLRKQAAALGLASRVQVTGYVEDTGGLLSALDLFVLPSLSEGQPLALLEAGANGRCIVASRVGGVPEILTDRENALLVEPGSADLLAQALAHLIANRSERERLGANAERTIRCHWSIRSVADRYLELLLPDPDLKKSGLEQARD